MSTVFNPFGMSSLNKFQSQKLLNKSHNKLHELTLCAIIVFYMILEYLTSVPHTQLSVPQSSSELQTQIQPQRPGR